MDDPKVQLISHTCHSSALRLFKERSPARRCQDVSGNGGNRHRDCLLTPLWKDLYFTISSKVTMSMIPASVQVGSSGGEAKAEHWGLPVLWGGGPFPRLLSVSTCRAPPLPVPPWLVCPFQVRYFGLVNPFPRCI